MTDVPSVDDIIELRELVAFLAYAACVWWILIAIGWGYWATGGNIGVWTLWGGTVELSGSREPWLVSLLWIVAIFALVPAALSLTMVNWWSRYVSTGIVSATAFLVGLTLVPYVAVDTLLQGLVLIEVLAGETSDRTGRAWRLLFWNPWWVLGVLLFCAGAWLNQYTLGLEEKKPRRHRRN